MEVLHRRSVKPLRLCAKLALLTEDGLVHYKRLQERFNDVTLLNRPLNGIHLREFIEELLVFNTVRMT